MIDGDTLRRSWRGFLSGDERRAGPWWAAYAWTLVFAVLCAVGFTVAHLAIMASSGEPLPPWWPWFQSNLVVSLLITLTIRLLFAASQAAIGRHRLDGWSRGRRTLYYSLVPIVGVSLAWPLGALWAFGVDVRRAFSIDRPGAMVGTLVLALLITLVFVAFFSSKAREIQAENRAAEARLRLLQGQMQPHFLFNTLANVVSLIEVDPPKARRTLESFVDYLRASLAGFGAEGSHTLGDELALVDAYLRIAATRMEERLRVAVDVADELRRCRVLPLVVQPLVENAVVHGLEPSIGGGSLRIAARRDGTSLVVVVEDDGQGVAAAAAVPGHRDGGLSDGHAQRGAGLALGNRRDRLRHAHAAAARLDVEPIAPHGTRATLRLPVATAAATGDTLRNRGEPATGTP